MLNMDGVQRAMVLAITVARVIGFESTE